MLYKVDQTLKSAEETPACGNTKLTVKSIKLYSFILLSDVACRAHTLFQKKNFQDFSRTQIDLSRTLNFKLTL